MTCIKDVCEMSGNSISNIFLVHQSFLHFLIPFVWERSQKGNRIGGACLHWLLLSRRAFSICKSIGGKRKLRSRVYFICDAMTYAVVSQSTLWEMRNELSIEHTADNADNEYRIVYKLEHDMNVDMWMVFYSCITHLYFSTTTYQYFIKLLYMYVC